MIHASNSGTVNQVGNSTSFPRMTQINLPVSIFNRSVQAWFVVDCLLLPPTIYMVQRRKQIFLAPRISQQSSDELLYLDRIVNDQ